jgi:hypothetical protein
LVFFNFAKWEAMLPMAHTITTCVAILPSHPCDLAACRILQQAVRLNCRPTSARCCSWSLPA